jgi:histone H3/H4
MNDMTYWKKCSTCKKPISFSSKFFLCSVSTCKHPRKGFVFCSVECWDAHLGFANHRESWAEEAVAPKHNEVDNLQEDRAPVRKIVDPKNTNLIESAIASNSSMDIKTDTLVVVSKVKQLIQSQSSFNTSQCCIDALTKKVVKECLKGIEKAKIAGRKTVMGRDIE